MSIWNWIVAHAEYLVVGGVVSYICVMTLLSHASGDAGGLFDSFNHDDNDCGGDSDGDCGGD